MQSIKIYSNSFSFEIGSNIYKMSVIDLIHFRLQIEYRAAPVISVYIIDIKPFLETSLFTTTRNKVPLKFNFSLEQIEKIKFFLRKMIKLNSVY